MANRSKKTEKAYQIAKERYARLGVDTTRPGALLERVAELVAVERGARDGAPR